MMFRLAALGAAAATVAVTAFAGVDAVISDEPEVIRIEVAPQELADCQRTLREVGAMPVVSDNGSPVVFAGADALPTVVCAISIDA
ncbi:hypothetical protein [Salipiger aestuarii]|uniref:Uncharacterized protein n=1 Tax=Salipiger aestuarii TaxID=568098 RepID=A0A327YFV4_9RHOB|nr:hypothetical protein [Salipiger aestuarii]EIE53096.1 hypothetical protein C357_00539 [Citreicella sp. 357]RAK18986.1 hypothetical protein ATI53_101028 [Salipiger aestuarii]